MRRTLGLDLGKNSIGWAILNSDTNEIIEMGAKIISPDRQALRMVKRASRRHEKMESLKIKMASLAHTTFDRHRLQVIASIAKRIFPFLLHGLLTILFATSILMAITTKEFQFWFNLAITILLGWIALRK